MGGRGSGGHNRLSAEAHVFAGTFRRDRHGVRGASPAPAEELAPADRRRTLAGLSPAARRLAVRLLDRLEGWTPASLAVLRSYVLSRERLDALEAIGQPSAELYKELRACLALGKALGLEK